MQPTSAINRLDLGLEVEEFNLAADRMGFIASQMLPFVTRDKPEGRFPKIKLEQLLTPKDTRRADNAAYGSSDSDWDEDVYLTHDHGHEVPVSDRQRRRYSDVVRIEQRAADRATDVVLRGYETEVATVMTDATNWSGRTIDLTASPWSDRANATPVDDIDAAREAIFLEGGMEPNALQVNRYVFRHLINNAQIIDRLKYQGFQDARPGEISAQALAISLDLERIIVAGSAKNTANPLQDRSLSRIWPNGQCVLGYVCETSDPDDAPCLGRTFLWGEEAATAGDMLAVMTEEYRDERLRGNRFRARSDYGIKFPLIPELGRLFINVV